MKLNRDIFFKAYRKAFGNISDQRTVDGLNFFLDKFELERRLKSIPEFAYVLATVRHEATRDGVSFQPVREKRASKTRQPKLYEQQNRYWNTGFYGRGFPQTTWEDNYRSAGKILGKGEYFVENPDELLKPEFAYEVMVVSMQKGLYRRDKQGNRHSLARYFQNGEKDYYNAREIINGDKKKNGYKIKAEAEEFEKILTASLISAEAITPSNEQLEPAQEAAAEQAESGKPQPGCAPGDAPIEVAAPEPTGFERWKLWLATILGTGGLGALLNGERLQQIFDRVLTLEATVLIGILAALGVGGAGFLLYLAVLRIVEKLGEYFLKVEEMRSLRDPNSYNLAAKFKDRDWKKDSDEKKVKGQSLAIWRK